MNTDPEILSGHKCPYCGGKSEWIKASELYSGNYDGMVYICRPCDAYVGCHLPAPDQAKGRLANKELRLKKIAAHYYFDKLWKLKMDTANISKSKARLAAYKWLSQEMNIPKRYCHIGMFDTAECEAAIAICKPIIDKLSMAGKIYQK